MSPRTFPFGKYTDNNVCATRRFWFLVSVLSCSQVLSAAPRIVTLPGKSPLVTLRFVFTTGAASDPADKPGVAHLTGELLAGSGTKDLTYKQMMDALYPMATSMN